VDWTVKENMVGGLFLCGTLSHAAEGVMPHLCKQERKRPTPVRRRLSRTYTLFLVAPSQ